MKKISRFLSFLSAFFGVWLLVRSPKGRTGGAVWLPKLWAGAWSPFAALAGALGAWISLARGDGPTALAGLFGAWAGTRHTLRVTRRDEDPFERAFGPDWEQRVPPELWTRLARPYQLLQPNLPLGPSQLDLDIGKKLPLRADLWLPPAGVPRTRLGVIFLHGGLWQAADKDFLTRPLFARLVNQGHAVLDVAYSLAPTANIYQMIGEVKQAIAWMKANAAKLDLDPERVVLMGSAGGAHLALLAAYTPNLPAFQPKGLKKADTSVRGVISISGISDLVSFYYEYGEANPRQPEFGAQITEDLLPRLHNQSALDRWITRARLLPAVRYSNLPGGALLLVNLLGGTLNEIPAIYELLSPLTHVGAHCPPTLLLTGDDDFVIDALQSRRLQRALQTMNVPAVYVEFPGTVHGFDQYFGVSRRVAPAAQMASNDIEQFLALLV